MKVDCEGCAGCCIDWRETAPEGVSLDHERRGRFDPIDDAYNLVVLTREDVRAFVDAGLADALTPRLFHADEGAPSVTVDGYDLAAIDGRPVFLMGLRKVRKPVEPFGEAPEWLPACAFLDPATLQCRIHDEEVYPSDCAEYPGHNLALDAESECERVEAAFGGERLVDDEPPADLDALFVGPQAVGGKVFVFPDAEELSGVVERVAAGELRSEDRARFVAAAAASAPGTTAVSDERYESVRERAAAESWVGSAVAAWEERAAAGESPEPELGEAVEAARGAPETPGWE
jgi:predicted transcriptional regulator